jgi:D-xylose transport system ATP-binding protein
MFLGREEKKGLALDEDDMEKRARKTLDGLSVRTLKSVRQHVSSLSGGQRQTVAIARAVLWNSKLVILDEPTAALGVAQTEQVLNLVRRLADNGLGVILISHNMNDVMQVADNIAALYLGTMAAQVKSSEVTSGRIVELITSGRSGELGIQANGGAA